MGDAAISATIEVVLGTVISLASDRIGLVIGFKEDLESLSNYAKDIQGLLAGADDQMHSRDVKNWIMQLEKEVFKAENVLDELHYENLRHEVKYRNQFKKTLCFFFSLCNTIGFRSGLASKIRDINTKLDTIVGRANNLGLVAKFLTEAAPPTTTTSRQTDSVQIPNVVGREEDEAKIVKMLLSPSEKPLSLLPIIGTGGLGKTTLAKSVYNNPDIERHFNKKTIWVCVAKQIEILDLFKLILESLTGKKVKVDQRNAIVKNIARQLEEERYFIVLDDMWNCEPRFWEDFLDTLEGINRTNGSWCLVTTRLQPMAETVSRHLKMRFDPYFLGKIDDDECWSIIKVKVVTGEEVPKELEAIKKKILRRCNGLPLAATLIGGLLLCKEKEEWGSIVQKSLLDGDQNDTKQIVKVSFDHLFPASVKKCFAYCSIFPQDTELEKNLLIELWMAEGFLQPERKDEMMMEEIGDKYFRILLKSSLLEKVRNPWQSYYKMHDLVHDFAKSVLNPESGNGGSYLALNSYEGLAVDIVSPLVRTLFLESGISSDILPKLKYLHVLKLSGKNVKMLPASIGALIHLRFLDISDSKIKTLPKSLCNLYSLQTLRIDVLMLNGLPKRLSNLISLRHLHLDVRFTRFKMPLGIGRLTCLITLEFFNVGQEKGHRIEEIGNLKHLKGLLVIRNLELVNGKEGAQLAKLCEKPYLSRLEFKWGSEDREADTFDSDDDVLEGLWPHPNLQKLIIENFMGYQFPQWFLNLSALEVLELRNCKRCTQLPTLGKLPSLQILCCSGLENIICIGLSFYGIDEEEDGRGKGGSGSTISGRVFPALKALNLINMENLVEWKDVEEVDLFPMLRTLRIENCPQLTTAPSHFPSIEQLDICNCHFSLGEKILSNITTLSSVRLNGDIIQYGDHQHIDFSYLVNHQRGASTSLVLQGCGSLPSEMLEHLCNIIIKIPNLQHLNLEHCSNLTSFKGSNSTCLESLRILNCENLRELPEVVHKFQALRSLEIEGCWNIDMEIPINGQRSWLPTSLEELRIRKFNSLTSLPVEMLESCKSLRRLMVSECSNLESFPLCFPKLQQLHLRFCPSIASLTSNNGCGTCLETMQLRWCENLRDLPEDLYKFHALRSLTVVGCPRINMLLIPKEGQKSPEILESCASSLRRSEVHECPNLVSFPLGSLTRLEHLALDYSLFEFDVSEFVSSSLPSLRGLELYGLPHVESLPGGLEFFTILTKLQLSYFGLEALPDSIGKLASLETLSLLSCRKLQYLPSIAAMRGLTKLICLHVYDCPLLKNRCTPGSGTDSEWPKISHIPKLEICGLIS